MTHPDVYGKISDDGAPPRREYDPGLVLGDLSVYALGWFREEKLIGVWVFHPRNCCTYEGHVAILPDYEGKGTIEAGQMAIKWIFENTPALKIIGMVSEQNAAAQHYALKTGMEPEGLIERAWLKDGRLWDMISYGICKEV